MTSFITTMFVSPPFPDTSRRALSPIFTLVQSISHHDSSGFLLPYELEIMDHVRVKSLRTFDLRHGVSSNARTRGQFKPRNQNKGNSSYQLRQFAEATLGSGSLRKAVKLPEGEDLSEWLAVNGRWKLFSFLGMLRLFSCAYIS